MIAGLFRDMRATLGMSVAELAVDLQTSPAVIMALEAGDIGALPPWPETLRVIDGYGARLRLDVRPALVRIEAMMHARTRAAVSSPGPASSPAIPHPAMPDRLARARLPGVLLRSSPSSEPAANPTAASSLPAVRAYLARPLARRAAIGVLVLLIALGAVSALPERLHARLDGLSPALAQSLRNGLGRLTQRSTTGELKWIEVSDPRARKTDRLDAQTR